MRPDISATPPVLLPDVPALGKLTEVATVSGADSLAPYAGSHPAPEQWLGEQGVVDPKPQPTDGQAVPIGRRAAPRLRLSLPAQLVAVEKAQTCILLNLSRTGAQVAILDAMREGEGALLRCGLIDQFVIITRSAFSLNALMFDQPLTDAIVLEMRRYHENFEEREKRALIETARKWVTGDTGDGRST